MRYRDRHTTAGELDYLFDPAAICVEVDVDRIVVVAGHSVDTDKACSLIKVHIIKVEEYVVTDTLDACSVSSIGVTVDKVAIGTVKPLVSLLTRGEQEAAEINTQIGLVKLKLDVLFACKTA